MRDLFLTGGRGEVYSRQGVCRASLGRRGQDTFLGAFLSAAWGRLALGASHLARAGLRRAAWRAPATGPHLALPSTG